MRWEVILAGLMLASCSGPAIQCDADGMIIVPKDASTEIASDWLNRNMDLAGKRLGKMTGDERSRWVTPASLEKAKGCP